MYSTKELFPKKAHSYITIGDPYQKKSAGADPRRQGKQFVNNPARSGVHFGGYKYMPTKYQQSNPYFVTQPPEKRKLGFGSHDAVKRDEFSNQIAMEQYREALKKEMWSYRKGKKHAAKAAAERGEDPNAEAAAFEAARAAAAEAKLAGGEELTLYDRCFRVEHDQMVGKSCSRHEALNRGPMWTAACNMGVGCTAKETAKAGANGAAHGRANVTKHFYNSNHLHVDD